MTDICPICAVPFVADAICAIDVEMGTCHAACLEGSPVVDLDNGEPMPDGEVLTFRYGSDEIAAFLKLRDESVEPHEATDAERQQSAEAILDIIAYRPVPAPSAAPSFDWTAATDAAWAENNPPSAAPAEPAGGGEREKFAAALRKVPYADRFNWEKQADAILAALQAAPAPHCQLCGGTVQGWFCQTCEAEFHEENGLLVLKSEAAPADPVGGGGGGLGILG